MPAIGLAGSFLRGRIHDVVGADHHCHVGVGKSSLISSISITMS